jgi:hypothetical protein
MAGQGLGCFGRDVRLAEVRDECMSDRMKVGVVAV